MANNRRLEEIKKRESKKKYDEAVRGLSVYPLLTALISVIVLITFSMEWASVYNVDLGGNEVEFSGFNLILAVFTDGYSKMDSSLGDIAVPFYYYAKQYCEELGVTTVIALAFAVITVIFAVIVAIKRAHKLNVAVAGCSVITAILLIICYAIALSMSGSDILPKYCSGNPACSISSAIIIPAIIALVSAVPSVIGAVKYRLAQKIIK